MTGAVWPVSFPVDTNLATREGEGCEREAISVVFFGFRACKRSSLAEVPHPHGVAGGGVEEGAGQVERDLVDLALARWDGLSPERRGDVSRVHLARRPDEEEKEEKKSQLEGNARERFEGP